MHIEIYITTHTDSNSGVTQYIGSIYSGCSLFVGSSHKAWRSSALNCMLLSSTHFYIACRSFYRITMWSGSLLSWNIFIWLAYPVIVEADCTTKVAGCTCERATTNLSGPRTVLLGSPTRIDVFPERTPLAAASKRCEATFPVFQCYQDGIVCNVTHDELWQSRDISHGYLSGWAAVSIPNCNVFVATRGRSSMGGDPVVYLWVSMTLVTYKVNEVSYSLLPLLWTKHMIPSFNSFGSISHAM